MANYDYECDNTKRSVEYNTKRNIKLIQDIKYVLLRIKDIIMSIKLKTQKKIKHFRSKHIDWNFDWDWDWKYVRGNNILNFVLIQLITLSNRFIRNYIAPHDKFLDSNSKMILWNLLLVVALVLNIFSNLVNNSLPTVLFFTITQLQFFYSLWLI
jgi:hypothetical protein